MLKRVLFVVFCSGRLVPDCVMAPKGSKKAKVTAAPNQQSDSDNDANVNASSSSVAALRRSGSSGQLQPVCAANRLKCHCELCLKVARPDGADWYKTELDLRGKPYPVLSLCHDCGEYVYDQKLTVDELRPEIKTKKRRDVLLTAILEHAANKANPSRRTFAPERVYKLTEYESSLEDRPHMYRTVFPYGRSFVSS
jgi:hypothetical protein